MTVSCSKVLLSLCLFLMLLKATHESNQQRTNFREFFEIQLAQETREINEKNNQPLNQQLPQLNRRKRLWRDEDRRTFCTTLCPCEDRRKRAAVTPPTRKVPCCCP
uniref:Putative neurotoxin 9 n=2 Tax=Scolopendra TaxID=41364 RepID=PNXA9_SCOMU|nr:RecName: Full=Putative neurotoxin 9; Flags: Precursor [Scolopendra mutilans]V9ISX2.1 RecName: Full=Putative neurotoxin 10; Flags: Precursor [Scolopendra subspinipes]AFM55029.1 putative neurotoxin 10 [Scolopendra subspinipes]